MAETYDMIDILIRKVNAAHIAYVTINHTDFPVVAVIQIGVERRYKTIKTNGTHAA